MSSNNLPAELPVDASTHFGRSLLPWLCEMASAPMSQPPSLAFQSRTLADAIITWNGSLTEKYKYIDDLRAKSLSMKKHVLLLGSGYVSRPVVDFLTREKNLDVTVASDRLIDAESICKPYPNARAVFVNVLEEKSLKELVSSHDIVVSLVPANLHPEIAKICLDLRKHLITASYVSKEMLDFHEK